MATLTSLDLMSIRLAIADPDSGDAQKFSDTTIQSVFDAEDCSVGDTIIVLIDNMIAEIARLPNMSDSGMGIQYETQLGSLRRLRMNAAAKYGLKAKYYGESGTRILKGG